MIELLLFREKVRRLYSKYDFYIAAIGKFFLALFSLLFITDRTGYFSELDSPFLSVALALVSSFLPASCITFFICGLILIHFAAVSIQIAIFTAVLFLIAFLLYFIVKPGNSYLTAVTILLCFLRIPAAVSIVLGLAAGPLAGIPVIFGIVIVILIGNVNTNFSLLVGQTSTMTASQKFVFGIDALIRDQYMWVIIAAIFGTICIVYWFSRLSVRYSWNIATVGGVVALSLFMLIPSIVMDAKVKLDEILLNVVAALIAAAVYHFFIFAVDYSRAEYAEFEDDEYYYYVKAIPKIKVTNTEVQVMNITAKPEEEEEGGIEKDVGEQKAEEVKKSEKEVSGEEKPEADNDK